MKKIRFFITFILILFIFNGNTYASSVNKIQNNKFEYINDLTLYDKDSNLFFSFESHSDLLKFLNPGLRKISFRSVCTPGMSGYPYCQNNPVVSTGSRYISHYNTDFIQNKELLLGNNGWVFGGTHGATMQFSTSKDITFSYDSLSFSIKVGKSSTFNVPPRTMGNIKYQAKWRIETREGFSIRKDGSKTGFYKYKVSKFLEGGFIGVYK